MISRHLTDAWPFIANMPDKSVSLILTDPMYDSTVNMTELRRVCSGSIIMFCAPLKPFFTPTHLAYWEKPPAPKNTSKSINQSSVEWILIEQRGTYNSGLFWANYTGVFHDTLLKKPVHPYEKPTSMLERVILMFTDELDIVFDPFMGSGNTLRAASRLGRHAIGCEIDPDYFKLSNDIL